MNDSLARTRAEHWFYGMLQTLGALWGVDYLITDNDGIDGVIELWAKNGTKKLSIYVNEKYVAIYIKAWGPNIMTEMEDGIVGDEKKLCELWQWLHT